MVFHKHFNILITVSWEETQQIETLITNIGSQTFSISCRLALKYFYIYHITNLATMLHAFKGLINNYLLMMSKHPLMTCLREVGVCQMMGVTYFYFVTILSWCLPSDVTNSMNTNF